MRNVDGLFKKEFYKDLLETTHFCEDVKLTYIEYEDATVLPYKVKSNGKEGGGVVTSTGEYLIDTGLHKKCNEAYPVEDVKCSEDKVIYIGMFNGIWGHHITDNLRRLWFLETEMYKEKYADYKVVYVAFPNFKFSGNRKELMDIMGIDCAQFIQITEPTKFKSVIVPDESLFLDDDCEERFFTREYRDLIHRVREYGIKNKKEIDFDKIYFTHSRYATLKELGETKLEAFFKKQGYKIIAPEKYSFREQLNMLVQCKSFAATVGSASHNIMFMQDGSEAILIPRSNYLTSYQLAVDEVANLNIKYIDSSMSIMTERNLSWIGPFYFYVSKELSDAFHEEVDLKQRRKDYRDFKFYVWLGKIKRTNLDNIDALDYYADALMRFAQERREVTLLNKIPNSRVILRKCINGLAYVITKCKGV